MIDTVWIELITHDLGILKDMRFNRVDDYNKNKEYYNCSVRNLKITYSLLDRGYKIKICGSLHKFLHGYNLSRFTRLDVKQSINLLSETIGIDIGKGVLKRVDFGANILVNNHPSFYNLFLYSWGRSQKDTYNNNSTVSFRGNGISLSFYDKVAEVKRDREAKRYYSSFLKDINVIRYELKLTKKLQKSLKLPQNELYVHELYTYCIYKRLVNLWYEQYKAVVKNLFYRPPEAYSKFSDYLKNEGIERLGGIVNTFQVLDYWSDLKGQNRQAKYTIKKKIRKEYRTLKPANKFIKELDRKIKFEKEFYL